MARPRREQSDPRVIDEWINDGRGADRNGAYQPWLRIQDLASHGECQRLTSHLTGDRIVHLLSGHETDAFFVYEWSPSVVDIREQFPLLPLAETQEIADELEVDHPSEPETKLPIVMTTDFLVTTRGATGERHFARALKEVKELGSKRHQAKLEIARRFHEKHGHHWSIITERDLPAGLIWNLDLLRGKRDLSQFGGVPEETIASIKEVLLPTLWQRTESLVSATTQCDRRLGIDPGTSLTVAYHLLYLRKWTADLTQRLDHSSPLILQSPQPKETNEILVQLPAQMA